MKKSSYDGRSRSVDRSSGQQQFGSARKRTSSVDRLSIYGRQSSSGRQSVAPLRIRNEGNHHQLPKAKNPRTSYDSRGSFGWKGPSIASGMGSRKTPQKNRSSFYSRQSAIGLSSHNGIPKDPRKLHDRGVQQRFITNVYEFLTENGYSHQITPKILASPTTKDFLKIFEFIYGQFEPKFKLGKKPEEEVPVLLKSLRYPFLISKSSIFAVGTSHTWPSVLAALDWMVNLIKFQKNVCVDDVIFLSNDGDFDEIPESRIKFDYIEKTYEAFLDGHDTFEEHDAKLAQTLNHKYYGVHGSVEGLAEEAKRLEIERDSLMKDVERLKVQQVKLAASVSDEQTYSQFVENLSSHEKTLQGQFSILQEECLALRLEHEEIHSKIQQMQQIYQRQELTPADINRINLERQELRRKKECAEKQIAEYDEEIWNYEKEMAKALEKVENKCSEYNKKARKLNLIPSTAENAFGVDYELSSSLSSYLSSAKVQETIKPALSELKKRISESIQQKEIEKIEKMNSVEQIEEHNDELRTQIAMDVAKVKRMDEEYDAKKQMYQREYQKSQETIDFLQKKIWEMRGASQQSVAEIEQDLWETAEMGRQKLEQKVNERKQYDQFLDAVNKSVIDHRIAISVHIEKMYNEGKATLEKLEKESEQLRKL